MNYKEEEAEHAKDKEKIQELIKKFDVELIVVGANSLEARNLKKTLSEIAEGLKSCGGDEGERPDSNREAFVIWGSMEIPKLFANSYICHKLFKATNDQCLKQAISLARWEQDPLNETLNLWSFVLQENQALQLNLHPMQRFVNQAKLADALEEINVKVVNSIGIDINLLVEHDHMHIMLSFVSGLGPRKAKKFITSMKQLSDRIAIRSDVFSNNLIMGDCYLSLIGFLKIRVSFDDIKNGKFNVLDQTRIHPESYALALKIASDIQF
jgi:transcription elongation factor SPT6